MTMLNCWWWLRWCIPGHGWKSNISFKRQYFSPSYQYASVFFVLKTRETEEEQSKILLEILIFHLVSKPPDKWLFSRTFGALLLSLLGSSSEQRQASRSDNLSLLGQLFAHNWDVLYIASLLRREQVSLTLVSQRSTRSLQQTLTKAVRAVHAHQRRGQAEHRAKYHLTMSCTLKFTGKLAIR